MKSNLVLAIATLSLTVGCTTSVHRGSVAMKLTETTAHVCLGNEEVNAGDSINVYRNVCTRSDVTPEKGGAKTSAAGCELKLIGQGKITEVLNSHYSVATIEASGGYQEGDIIEKSAS